MQKFKKKKVKEQHFIEQREKTLETKLPNEAIFSLNHGRWTCYVAQLKK